MKQIRFAFTDAERRMHTLVMLQGAQGQEGAAVLDGTWVCLKVLPGEGRAEYRHGSFHFQVESDHWGSEWTLRCAGRAYKSVGSGQKLDEDRLSRMELGPANLLVDGASTAAILSRHGWGGDGGGVKPWTGLQSAHPEREFYARLKEHTPYLVVTPLVVVANFVIFGAMVAGGVYTSDDPETILSWGADYAPRVAAGQWWRLLTAIFLHDGFLHLFFNMLFLVPAGIRVERIVGNAGFLALYMVSGLFASVSSLYCNPGLIGLGASGAVFGVLGGLVGLIARYHVYFRRREIVAYVALGLLLLVPGILGNLADREGDGGVDMVAHVAGFVAGGICGVVMSRRISGSVRRRRAVRSLLVTAAGLAVVGGLAALKPAEPDVYAHLARLKEADKRMFGEFEQALRSLKGQELAWPQFVETVEEKMIKPWRRAAEDFMASTTQAPGFLGKVVRCVHRFIQMREGGLVFLKEGLHRFEWSTLELSGQRLGAAGTLEGWLVERLPLEP